MANNSSEKNRSSMKITIEDYINALPDDGMRTDLRLAFVNTMAKLKREKKEPTIENFIEALPPYTKSVIMRLHEIYLEGTIAEAKRQKIWDRQYAENQKLYPDHKIPREYDSVLVEFNTNSARKPSMSAFQKQFALASNEIDGGYAIQHYAGKEKTYLARISYAAAGRLERQKAPGFIKKWENTLIYGSGGGGQISP